MSLPNNTSKNEKQKNAHKFGTTLKNHTNLNHLRKPSKLALPYLKNPQQIALP
jgi:hypothetical protein